MFPVSEETSVNDLVYKVISIQLFTAVISVILKPGSTKVSQTSIR